VIVNARIEEQLQQIVRAEFFDRMAVIHQLNRQNTSLTLIH
jgi:hypothetical protein